MSQPADPATKPRRSYHSPRRQQQAGQTRARILEAARPLLAAHGYAGTTVEAIAQAAGVAVQTVYAVFGSKRGILAELLETARRSPVAEELRVCLRATADPVARVRLAAGIGRRIYDQMAPELELLRGARLLAPELASVERELEEERRASSAPLIAYLTSEGHQHPKLSAAQAADVLWALTGPDLYCKLVLEQGWSADAYERLVGDLLVAALLRSAEAGEPGSI